MRPLLAAALVAAAAGLPCAAYAQRDNVENRSTLLITPAALAERINSPNLVLLHLGDRAQYDSAHIPGARYVALQDVSVSGPQSPDGLTLQLPSSDYLRSRLAALDISDNSYVVVYYGRDWISPTTRVMLTLDYAGLGDRTVMLDGGMPRWQREGHPVTANVPDARTGALSPLKTKAS